MPADVPLEMHDPHFLPAHMLAARNQAAIEAHIAEDIRRFDAFGREIKDAKDTMNRGFDKMETKHDALSEKISEQGKKLAYLLGGIVSVIEIVKMAVEYLPKIHGG